MGLELSRRLVLSLALGVALIRGSLIHRYTQPGTQRARKRHRITNDTGTYPPHRWLRQR
jgi:hypothetical protein